jgi:hypothetical protein
VKSGASPAFVLARAGVRVDSCMAPYVRERRPFRIIMVRHPPAQWELSRGRASTRTAEIA